jgi:hypothetical protein
MQSSQTGAKKALSVVASIALAFAGTVGISSSASAADAGKVYLNFEAADNLGAATGAFEGAVRTIEASPVAAGGIGGDGNAMKVVKSGQPWAGVNMLLAGSTAYRYAPASSSVISFDYYAEIASPVMLKLEGGGSSVKKAVAASVGWNHFDVDMSTGTGWDATKEYVIFALFPDFSADDTGYTGTAAVAPAGQIFWVDNVSINGGTVDNVNGAGNGTPGAVEAVSTLVTFETGDNLGAQAITGAFEGAATDILDAAPGGNGGKALRITKAGNAWSGVNLFTAASGFKFLDATHTSVTMNYFSPETVNTPVQFQLSGGGSTINQAVQAVPGWQKLTFDFSASYNDAKDYTAAVIFPNFVNAGDVPGYTGAAAAAVTGQYYFVDNIGFNGATTPAITVPKTAPSLLLTFEADDANGSRVLNACGGAIWECAFEGAVVAIADAPAGGNGGKALKITKSGQPWAGLNLLLAPENTKLADATHSHVTFNYFSPDSVKSPVQIQLISDTNATISMAVEASPGWQRLDIDMSTANGYSSAASYVKMVIFPNFVNKGDVPSYTGADAVAVSNQNYYLDNVGFNGATTPAIPAAPVTVAPVQKTAASISGTAKIGKTLTVSKGSWTGTPTPTYSYKWYRCTVSGSTAKTTAPTSSLKCVAVAGKTSTTYKLAAADKGKYIRAFVTVKNSKGTKYSLTKTTAKVS